MAVQDQDSLIASVENDPKLISLDNFGSSTATLEALPEVATTVCIPAHSEPPESTVQNFVTRHRGILVTIFLLPISFLFSLYDYFRNLYVIYLTSNQSEESHLERVKRVQAQVLEAKAKGIKKLCTARPANRAMSFRVGKYKSEWFQVDLNDFQNVLNVDVANETIRCEPLCNMVKLSHFLTKQGYSLAVTPELDELTVGGLIMGFGIESSSHKYGLFQNICVALEVVLPNGEFKRCTKEENSDLFYALPWSHGFLVAAEIKIVPSKKYVKLEYIPCNSTLKYLEEFKQASNDKTLDFVECLVYSKTQAVVMRGTFVGDLERKKYESKFNPIGYWFKPWFYQYVQSYLVREADFDIIPIRDYYHRHTRSIFWELKEIIPFADHFIFRYLLGWMMPISPSLLKMTQTEGMRRLYEIKHAVQDMLVPMAKLESSLDCMHEQFEVYPIWLCPMELPAVVKGTPAAEAFLYPPGYESEMYVDVGVYGSPPFPNYNAKESLKKVEAFVVQNNGFQALYADCLLSKEDFRKMFDHTLYDKVRAKYQLDVAFPEVYDKVSLSSRR